MEISPKLIDRLSEMVRRRNGELAFDALLKAGLGIVFSMVVFGFVFWLGWFVGFFIAFQVNVSPWQFSAIFTGLFIGVATWSAWRRVNPLAGLKPMTEAQWTATLLGQLTGSMIPGSPRHASAGMALILLGGPANLFEAVGIWAHRLRADDQLIEESARLLTQCKKECPIEKVRVPAAAFLLRRLALIKVTRTVESAVLNLTDKGFALLGKTRA